MDIKEKIEFLETEKETRIHIDEVRRLLHRISIELIKRGEIHDASKLEDLEMKGFSQVMKDLKNMSYDSQEYRDVLQTKLKTALDHHYANNRHHPQFHPNGINGMTLIDLIEMFCDWKAATLKHNDGNILRSIEINSKRFQIDNQLTEIFRNTAEALDK